MTLEVRFESIRDSIRVNPASPNKFDEQEDGSGLGLVKTIRVTNSNTQDIDSLVASWRSAVDISTKSSKNLADKFPGSTAAWTRLAFSFLVSGDTDQAIECAKRCFALARDHDQDNFIDFPALAGATRILASQIEPSALIELIESCPKNVFLNGILASLVASTGDIDKALEISKSTSGKEIAGLVGYLQLRKGNLPLAIQNLRAAIEHQPSDVDAFFNIAIAMYQSKSLKKALKNLAVAFRLSPGRKDIREFYLDLLAESRNWGLLKSVVDQLREGSTIDSAEIRVAEARLALVDGDNIRSLENLKIAQILALDSGKELFAAELKGNELSLSHSLNKISRQAARMEMQSLVKSFPNSLVLLDFLCGLSARRSESDFLKEFVALQQNSESALAFSVRSRFAYLECRFDDYLQELRLWSKNFPRDVNAISFLINAEGTFGNNWNHSAELARKAIQKFTLTPMLVNQASYSLALANKAQEAEALLKSFPERNFLLEATLGLVKMSLGEIDVGLKHYRKAGEMALEAKDGQIDLALMAIYQGMALYRLNLVTEKNIKLLKAGALPNIPLPKDWEDFPAFVSVKWVTDLHTWPWPPMID